MSRKKKKNGHGVISLLVVLVLIMACAMFFIGRLGAPADSSATDTVSVTIEQGSGTQAIAETLEENGVIDSVFRFRVLSKIEGNDGQYKAGTYELSPSMTMEEIMQKLIEGNEDTITFTVPEGYSLSEIADVIAETGVCTSQDLLNEAANGTFDYDFLTGLTGENRLEGFLFPSTYNIYKDSTPHEVIVKMLDQFKSVYDTAYASSDPVITSSYGTAQIVTVASLIEKEAKLDDERSRIASVIYNRLNIGMRLQIDATVQYALGKHKDRLYESDLKVDSPYNTYLVNGLPAGPICSPGESSIRAALAPEATDYIYYVASPAGDGSHNFASTDSEFEQYKQEYLNSLDN